MLRIYAILFALMFCFAAMGAQLTVAEKTLDFQQLLGRIKSSYGPLHYKKDALGIDIDVLEASYLAQIQESKKKIKLAEEKFWYPQARFLVPLAIERFRKNKIDNIDTLVPIYLYSEDCQVAGKK